MQAPANAPRAPSAALPFRFGAAAGGEASAGTVSDDVDTASGSEAAIGISSGGEGILVFLFH